MNTPNTHTPPWSTAAFGGEADTSPMDLAALEDHLTSCRGGNRHLSNLRFAAERTNGFVSGHFVSSLLLLMMVVVGVGILVL